MSDWRLNGQEMYLDSRILYRISFPEFWRTAYRTKNKFYQKIDTYARSHVERTGQGAEWLEGEKIQHFWHEHCEFCRDKALTDKQSVFYCTEDMYYWVCEDCCRDFKEQFHWQLLSQELLNVEKTMHQMNLNPGPFEMIKSGKKTIELRLFDEKRQKIKAGDTVVFTNTATGEALSRTVVRLHCFASFAELYQALPLLLCGYTEEDIHTARPSDMEQYYPAEVQSRCGVVGIELSLPEKKAE